MCKPVLVRFSPPISPCGLGRGKGGDCAYSWRNHHCRAAIAGRCDCRSAAIQAVDTNPGLRRARCRCSLAELHRCAVGRLHIPSSHRSCRTFLDPTLAAITMGTVGVALFDRQFGRNQAFNSAGNVAAASLDRWRQLSLWKSRHLHYRSRAHNSYSHRSYGHQAQRD